jgi:hypothetical protein
LSFVESRPYQAKRRITRRLPYRRSTISLLHTTLGRYFERPEVRKELKQASERLRAAQRALAARRRAERRQDQELRRKARAQAAAEREQARRARAAAAEIASRGRRPRTDEEVWLDERAARMPLTLADLHSQNDDIAAGVVAAGGGMQALIAATDLRTRENVVGLIDPAILVQALDNDLLAQVQPPPLIGSRGGDSALAESAPTALALPADRADTLTVQGKWAGGARNAPAPDTEGVLPCQGPCSHP